MIRSVRTWVNRVCFPSSNIPFILIVSKIIFASQQLPFVVKRHRFMITRIRKYHTICFIVVSVLHMTVALKWFMKQWLYPSSEPVWEFVYIYYCITLFVAGILFTTQFTLLKNETVILLNSGVQIEHSFNLRGRLVRNGLKIFKQFGHIRRLIKKK